MANHFERRDGELFAEQVALAELATRYGTPLYVYSEATLRRHFHAWHDPLGDRGLVCYAVKANSNLAVLALLASLGSGFDIVSAGELERVLQAGGRADRTIFSGVAKSEAEMGAALQAGIHCFNVESEPELHRLNRVAGSLGLRAPVSLRVNPDVDARTHPYISTGLRENKFGIAGDDALRLYREAADLAHLDIVGIDCHIGSQLTELSPYFDALDRVLELVDALAGEGIALEHIDLGGGLGVTYRDETPPLPAEYLEGVFERVGARDVQLLFEPGRSIAANAGVLLTTVEYLKSNRDHHFAVVDAGMNDLLRPSLYQAWMEISAVQPRDDGELHHWDVVGPVCETGDFLGKARPLNLREGDLLCVHSAGAYGFSMSSNYNSRPRPAEVMVSGGHHRLIRRREQYADLFAAELDLPGADDGTA